MEHAFLSEVLQHCWFIRHHRVEVIRPDVDAGGYDLVLEANGRVRHVQLKSHSAGGAKGAPTLINSRLRDHSYPCVVRISWKPNPETCRVDLRYRYSEKANWPPPEDGARTFELKGAHFVPSTPAFFETSDLVDRLFGSATPSLKPGEGPWRAASQTPGSPGLAIQVIMDDSEVTTERMHRTCMEVSSQVLGFALEPAKA